MEEQLYNEYHRLTVENVKLKTLVRELYDVCIANGLGQQSSQFNTLYDDVIKHIER